jgi:hypothetical protein
MNASDCFNRASDVDKLGSRVFYAVLILSLALLIFPKPAVEENIHPCLIVLAVLAILCTSVTSYYQTEGNRALRESQISDGLGAAIGNPANPGYYNNSVPPSIFRLAVTTLENTLFTRAVLASMARKERINNCFFFVVLLALLSFRWTSTGWLLALAQALFSGDLILKWIRLERFRMRTSQVHEKLKQFFLQQGNVNRPNDLAILIAAFTDYECAKDEAATPLEKEVFDRLNPAVSAEWQQLKTQLQIG